MFKPETVTIVELETLALLLTFTVWVNVAPVSPSIKPLIVYVGVI